jgi:hypothetical protein
MQGSAITEPANLTVDVAAPPAVIDPIAVADAEATLGTARSRAARNCLQSTLWSIIFTLGRTDNNVSAAAWTIAASAIRMVAAESAKNARAVHRLDRPRRYCE